MMGTARHLGDELEIKRGGIIEHRALTCSSLLARACATSPKSDSSRDPTRVFADVSRMPTGGRGYEGVFEKAEDYWNPFEEALGHVSATR